MRIVHIDMDDTLCNFTHRKQEMLSKEPDIKYPQSQYGFFSGLDPLPGAVEYVNKLREIYNVYILTRPSVLNPLCYTEKRVWVEKHFGLEMCHKLILCPNKSLVKGDYLVDDVLWSGFEGRQIMFGSTTYPTWETVHHYLLNQDRIHRNNDTYYATYKTIKNTHFY